MRRFALVFVALALLADPLHAASKEDLDKLKQSLEVKRQQDAKLKKQLNKTESELRDLRNSLVRATREQKDSEETLLGLQDKLDDLELQEDAQRAELKKQHGNISDVLVAMLRLSRNPSETMLLQPDAPIDAMRAAMLMRRSLPFFAEKAQSLSSKLEKLAITRENILDKQKQLQDARAVFAEKQEKLNTLLTERQTWLKATESQRADVTKQINALSDQAKDLQDLLNKVAVATIKSKMQHPEKLAFAAPTKGRVLYAYGAADDVGVASRGLTYRVKAGDMITAPADGQVVFAGPFKGYGNIVIIKHGEAYHSFISGFGQVDAATGQVVNAGEPLGRAASDQGATAQLYYELRIKGAPVDPMKYIGRRALAGA